MTTELSIHKNPESKARCLALYDAALACWPVPYEQLVVATRFGSTHVIASGPDQAPPLVLLHGNWATATMWSSIIAELSCEFRTYAIDQIDDVGKSIPTRIPTSRSEYAEWLSDVCDQLRLHQADFMGLSYGGFLATNFALYAPGQVKRLVLLCPGIPNFGLPTSQYAIHGMPLILFPSQRTGRWLIQGLSVKGYRFNDLEANLLIASAMGLRSRIPFRPVFTNEELRDLEMPVFLIIGEREVLYEARLAVDRAQQLIPHIETAIIPDAGHMLTTDQPDEVIKRVMMFLQKFIFQF
jgi:pimeloyl-ACP methyl ester carboxylesterase